MGRCVPLSLLNHLCRQVGLAWITRGEHSPAVTLGCGLCSPELSGASGPLPWSCHFFAQFSAHPRGECAPPGSLRGYNISWYVQMFRCDKEVSVYQGLILSFNRDLRAFCKGLSGLWECSRLLRGMFLRVCLPGLCLCFIASFPFPPVSALSSLRASQGK